VSPSPPTSTPMPRAVRSTRGPGALSLPDSPLCLITEPTLTVFFRRTAGAPTDSRTSTAIAITAASCTRSAGPSGPTSAASFTTAFRSKRAMQGRIRTAVKKLGFGMAGINVHKSAGG
jgi:hypothetical protein